MTLCKIDIYFARKGLVGIAFCSASNKMQMNLGFNIYRQPAGDQIYFHAGLPTKIFLLMCARVPDKLPFLTGQQPKMRSYDD